MNLGLIILRTGQILVSEMDEMDYEPKVHLTEPHEISGKTKVVLTKWPPYSKDSHILLRSDDLLTVCDPDDKIVGAYLKKVGKTLQDVTDSKKEPEPVILNEEVNPDIYDDDDYEPRYTEI